MEKPNFFRWFFYINLLFFFGLILFPSPSTAQLQQEIVFMGDSITNCPTCSQCDDHCCGVSSAGECYATRVANDFGIPYFNAGEGSKISADGLSKISDILRDHNPKLLTIYFGTNDANQTEVDVEDVYYNLKLMVQRCKDKGTKPILATIGPQFGFYDQYKWKIDKINRRIRDIASEEGIRLADVGRELDWNQRYMYDSLHPNSTGHAIIADTFKQAIMAGCAYTIDPASVVLSASGGVGSVSVTSGTTCPWKVASNVDWIDVTAGSYGIGSGTVHYSVDANRTNQGRTGTISIAGKIFTLEQKKRVGLPWLMLLLEN